MAGGIDLRGCSVAQHFLQSRQNTRASVCRNIVHYLVSIWNIRYFLSTENIRSIFKPDEFTPLLKVLKRTLSSSFVIFLELFYGSEAAYKNFLNAHDVSNNSR